MDPTSRNDLIDEILSLDRVPENHREGMRLVYQSCETYELHQLRDRLRVLCRIGAHQSRKFIDPQAVYRDRMVRDFNSLEVQGHA